MHWNLQQLQQRFDQQYKVPIIVGGEINSGKSFLCTQIFTNRTPPNQKLEIFPSSINILTTENTIYCRKKDINQFRMQKQIEFNHLLISSQLGTSLIRIPEQQNFTPFDNKIIHQHKKKRKQLQSDRFDYKKFSEIIFKNIILFEGYYKIFDSEILSNYACIIDTVGLRDPKIQRVLRQYQQYKQSEEKNDFLKQLSINRIIISLKISQSPQDLLSQIQNALRNRQLDTHTLLFFDLSKYKQLLPITKIRQLIKLIFINIPILLSKHFPVLFQNRSHQQINDYLQNQCIHHINYYINSIDTLYNEVLFKIALKMLINSYPLTNIYFFKLRLEGHPFLEMINSFIQTNFFILDSFIQQASSFKQIQEQQIKNKIWHYFQKFLNRQTQKNCQSPFNSGIYILILKGDELDNTQHIQKMITNRNKKSKNVKSSIRCEYKSE